MKLFSAVPGRNARSLTLIGFSAEIFNVVFVFLAARIRVLYETRQILSSEAWRRCAKGPSSAMPQ
jgi:hypothetical protein